MASRPSCEAFENCDGRFLKPTIELIRPRVLVSLGESAYAAIAALYGLPRLAFRDAVNRQAGCDLGNGTRYFSLYHCGARILHTHRTMDQQLSDWQRVGRALRSTEIDKGGRHQKVIGNFGENLVCNWLSRSGFEVALVDHTGIDVVAYKRGPGRLGITVKSRTRARRLENAAVNLFFNRHGKDDRRKLKDACEVFCCEPWIAVYVEREQGADLYITSLQNYDCKYRRAGKAIDDWSMSPKCRKQYSADPEVKHIHVDFEELNWGW